MSLTGSQVGDMFVAKAAELGIEGVGVAVKAIWQAIRSEYPELDERKLEHVSGELEAAKRAADRLAGR